MHGRFRLAQALRLVYDRGADRVVVAPEGFGREILDGLGVGERFAHVVGGDSGPARKPDPASSSSVSEGPAVGKESQ